MSTAPHMPLFCGDYLKDTTDLTLEEHGAFLKILMITWATGGKALPDDPVRMAARLGITKERWLKKIRPALTPMFDLSDGTWRNERLEREWKIVQQKIAVKRANGMKGGRPATVGGPDDGPENGEGCTAETLVQQTENSDDNSLKNKQTTKANGYAADKLTESTHPHIESTYREEDSSPYSNTQKPAPAPIGAGGNSVAYTGKSFSLNAKDYTAMKQRCWALPDFLGTLQNLDAIMAIENEGKPKTKTQIHAALNARIFAIHSKELRFKQDRAEQQKAKTIVKRRPGNRVIGGINARAS